MPESPLNVEQLAQRWNCPTELLNLLAEIEVLPARRQADTWHFYLPQLPPLSSQTLAVLTGLYRHLAAEAEALRISEAHWRSITEHSPDHIMALDPDGTIQYINHTVPDLTKQKVIGTKVFDYVHPQFWPAMQECFDQVTATGEPGEYEVDYRTAEGQVRYFHSRVGPVTRGDRIVGLTVSATDMTDRYQTEKALREERHRLSQMLTIQENERRLLAYEIHDGFVQYVTAAMLHIDAGEIDTARGHLLQSLEDSRRLISGLRPPILDESGVISAIEYLVREHETTGMHVRFHHEVEFERLEPVLESAIFRITQEALTNVRRHAKTDNARVELREIGPRVHLRIRDWGAGFSPTQVGLQTFGLAGIQERARMLNGLAMIESSPGAGTLVLADLPLLKTELDS